MEAAATPAESASVEPPEVLHFDISDVAGDQPELPEELVMVGADLGTVPHPSSNPWVCAWSLDSERESRPGRHVEVVHTIGDAVSKTIYPEVDVGEEACFVAECASAEGGLEALQLAHRWTIDTGCGKDLLAYKMAM